MGKDTWTYEVKHNTTLEKKNDPRDDYSNVPMFEKQT